MESETRGLFHGAHQPGGGVHHSACGVSAALDERAEEMQQRILHGVMAVNAFISLLNHNGSSQCGVFSGVLWSFRGLFSVYLVSCLPQETLFFLHIVYFIDFYKGKRQFTIFLGQRKIWTFIYVLTHGYTSQRSLAGD